MNRHVLICGLLLAGCAVLSADDNAGNYSTATTGTDRWMSNGHRGALNSGPWSFESGNGGATGRFIGSSGLDGMGNINTDGKCFAIFANPPGDPAPFYAARKTFAKPALATGDTITFQVVVNFRNGFKGFNLRDTSDTSVWTFNVGRVDGTNGGYYIRNGPSSSANYDNGQQFGGYHANSVFTFTFTQRERVLDWTVVRSGGMSATVTGSAPVQSGTMGSARFFITGTDAGGLPANNLYFNNFTFATTPRGDAPLTLGERRLPGRVPSYFLRFSDPVAASVTVRHGGDGFTQSFPLAKIGDVWEIDIRTIPLGPGWHEFKFRPDSAWESGDNRRMWINGEGKIALPPAVYLTWTGDPTTTMVAHWHNDDAAATMSRHRPAGSGGAWTTLAASTTVPFPHTERHVHTVEITGLTPGGEYEFEVDGYDETFRFRPLPASLDVPLKFGVGGDVDVGSTADAMTAAISSHDPAFLVVGGDVAYADGRAENFWKWMRYFESWFHNARAPDGRLIPKVMAIGNHEVRNGYTQNHPDFDNTAAWRLRYAPYFYRFFAFPGPTGHGVLDAGDYLSLVVLDSDHGNLIVNQNTWLAQTLDARRDRKHLIPIYHVPAYPSHRSFDDEFSVRVRQNWVPLFENAGVHLAFEHHDHTFKRTKPLLASQENPDGIVYLGDGLWGIGSRVPDTGRWYLEPGASANHHVHLVTLAANGRAVRSVNVNGEFFGGTAPDHVLVSQAIDGIPVPPGNARVERLRPDSVRLAWDEVPNAVSYQIRRDGQIIGSSTGTTFTDSGREPESSASYTIAAVNRSGPSGQGSPVDVTFPPQTVPPFALDGAPDSSGYLLASPGLSLHAALRGEDLYLATRTPSGGGNDHFLLVTDQLLPSSTAPARWAKSGFTAHPSSKPYLGAENNGDYISWSNAPASSGSARAASAGGVMEGVLDLVDTFGAMPQVIHVAAAAYQTADGGVLVEQAPAGNSDGNIDPGEFLSIPLETLRDSTGTGVFDRRNPALGFRASAGDDSPASGFTVRWTSVPGKRYQLWRSTTLSAGEWEKVHPEPLTGPSGASEMSHTDAASVSLGRAFYRVEAVEP